VPPYGQLGEGVEVRVDGARQLTGGLDLEVEPTRVAAIEDGQRAPAIVSVQPPSGARLSNVSTGATSRITRPTWAYTRPRRGSTEEEPRDTSGAPCAAEVAAPRGLIADSAAECERVDGGGARRARSAPPSMTAPRVTAGSAASSGLPQARKTARTALPSTAPNARPARPWSTPVSGRKARLATPKANQAAADPQAAQRRWRVETGMTLVEIMIVVAIIGIVVGGVAMAAFASCRRAQVMNARKGSRRSRAPSRST